MDNLKLHFNVLTFILICINSSHSLVRNDLFCIQRGPCSCTGNNGEKIDLSPLANLSKPLLASSKSHLYIYHPCSDAPLNSIVNNSCKNGYGICYFTPHQVTDETLDYDKVIRNQTLGNFTRLAVNKEAVLRPNGLDQFEIVYLNLISDNVITTTVRLQCNEKIDTYKLAVTGFTDFEHVLTLSSQYACLKIAHYISGVAVFFLLLLSFAALYFIGGLLVLKFIRGATGIEMIPNHEFWCNLPQKMKAGFDYLKNFGRGDANSYEKI